MSLLLYSPWWNLTGSTSPSPLEIQVGPPCYCSSLGPRPGLALAFVLFPVFVVPRRIGRERIQAGHGGTDVSCPLASLAVCFRATECHGQVCFSGPSKPLEVLGVYNRSFLISFCFSQAFSYYPREHISTCPLGVIHHPELSVVWP